MKHIAIISSLIFFSLNTSQSQVPLSTTEEIRSTAIEWDKTIGGSSHDYLRSLQHTSDGGYILGGQSYSNTSGDKTEDSKGGPDYWVVKLSSTGNVEWDKTIGGSSYEILRSIQQTSDGGFVLGGWSGSNVSGDKSENSKGGFDCWVVKLTPTGNAEWDKTIGGSGYDWLSSLQQTSDGGYILGGTSWSNISGDKTENSRGGSDYWVVKLTSAGIVEWDKTFGGSLDDYLTTIQKTSDGGYIIGGYSSSNASGEKSENSKGSRDYWVVKLSSMGMVEWDKTIGGSARDDLTALQQTIDGGYMLGGYSLSNASGDKSENAKGRQDYWVVKLTSSGVVEWDKTIGGSSSDVLGSLQQTTDGGYILGGISNSNASIHKSEDSKGYTDFWLVKLTSTGNLEWDKTIGTSSYDHSASIEQSSDGGYIVGGYTASNISGDKSENSKGDEDYWIMKLSGDSDNRIEYQISGAFWSDRDSYRPIPWLRGRVQFSFEFSYDLKADKPVGSGFIRMPKAPMYFRKSTLETYRIKGQRTILTGTGTVNMEGNYTFSIDYKYGYTDRVRVMIWDEEGEIFYDSQYGDEEGAYPTSFVGDFDDWFTNEGLPRSTINDVDDLLADVAEPRIYPNPSGANGFTYQFNSEESQRSTMQIYDLRGIQVYESNVDVLEGVNEIQVNPGLKNGNYLLRISGGNLLLQERLIIQQ